MNKEDKKVLEEVTYLLKRFNGKSFNFSFLVAGNLFSNVIMGLASQDPEQMSLELVREAMDEMKSITLDELVKMGVE